MIYKGFRASNCPRWPLCAAARFQPFDGGGLWQRNPGNISLGLSREGTTLRTGSTVYIPSDGAKLLPAPFPAAGQRPENICRSGTGRCSEHRRMVPSCHRAADNSHRHCCNSHAPISGRCEIVGRSSAVWDFPIGFPFADFENKKDGLLDADRPMAFYAVFDSWPFFFSLVRLAFSRL